MIAIDDAAALRVGAALGAASIASFGPNNMMLMREGLVRGRPLAVALLVGTSYVLLLTAAACLGERLQQASAALAALLAWLGVGVMAWFGLAALRSGLRRPPAGQPPAGAGTPIRRALGTVWLNPLTHLELLLVPAAISAALATADARLSFLLGYAAVALGGVLAYAFGGRLLAPLLGCRSGLRLFDAFGGAVLVGLAIILAGGLTHRAASGGTPFAIAARPADIAPPATVAQALAATAGLRSEAADTPPAPR